MLLARSSTFLDQSSTRLVKSQTCRSSNVEKRTLPKSPAPRASCNARHASPNLLLASGHLPTTSEGDTLAGVASGGNLVGKPIEEGKCAEKVAGLSTLAMSKRALGDDLDNVE